MLELALLGLLTDQPLHGYEMKKQLSELVGARAAVSFGSLYPRSAASRRPATCAPSTRPTGPRSP